MAYQNVLEIPRELRGKESLSADELKQLEQCSLQFFVRESKYHILHDFPALGAFKKRLVSSEIEGPFETAPEIKNQKEYLSESEREIKEVLIPTRLMPVNFEQVSLAEYETATDCYSQDFLTSFSEERLDSDKVWQIGGEVLQKVIKNNGKDVKGIYRTIINNCMLEFELRKEARYEKLGAPKVRMAILGRGEEPERLINRFGVKAIEKEYEKYCLFKEVGIKDSVRRGLAYNFSFDGSSIDEVVKRKNVVI